MASPIMLNNESLALPSDPSTLSLAPCISDHFDAFQPPRMSGDHPDPPILSAGQWRVRVSDQRRSEPPIHEGAAVGDEVNPPAEAYGVFILPNHWWSIPKEIGRAHV